MLFSFYVFGISAGAVWLSAMGSTRQVQVTGWFDAWSAGFLEQLTPWFELYLSSLWRHLLLALLIWFCGTSLAGIPAIYGIIVLKGFMTGFTSGFLIGIKGFRGLLYAVSVIFPAELVRIPVLFSLAGIALSFAAMAHEGGNAVKSGLSRYCADFAPWVLFMFILSLAEALILPGIMRWMPGIVL